MRHKKNGFTLLEILIALFIFTIVSLIMVSALHNSMTNQSETEKKSARLNELQIALILVSRDIEQVINRPIMNSKNVLENAFIGTPNTITFTRAGLANPFGQLSRATLQRVRYSLKKNNFIRDTWDGLDQVADVLPHSRILLTTVTALQFEYLDAKGNFQKSWPPPEQSHVNLPRAVRVTLTLENWGTLTQLYLIPGQNSDTKSS